LLGDQIFAGSAYGNERACVSSYFSPTWQPMISGQLSLRLLSRG